MLKSIIAFTAFRRLHTELYILLSTFLISNALKEMRITICPFIMKMRTILHMLLHIWMFCQHQVFGGCLPILSDPWKISSDLQKYNSVKNYVSDYGYRKEYYVKEYLYSRQGCVQIVRVLKQFDNSCCYDFVETNDSQPCSKYFMSFLCTSLIQCLRYPKRSQKKPQLLTIIVISRVQFLHHSTRLETTTTPRTSLSIASH